MVKTKTRNAATHPKTKYRDSFPIILGLLIAAATGIILAKFLVDFTTAQDNSTSVNSTRLSASSNLSSPDNTTSESNNTSTYDSSSSDYKVDTLQYEGDDPNTSESISGSITAAYVSAGKLTIRVNIDQYLSSGTCQLSLTKDSFTDTHSAPIIPNASNSTCEGFDLLVSDFESGTYNINIYITSGDRYGNITSEVTL